MKNLQTFEEFINESSINEDSYAKKSMLIRGSEKEKSLDALKRNRISPKIHIEDWMQGDCEFEFRDSKEAEKAEAILTSLFGESVVTEADMSRDYDGFVIQHVNKAEPKWKFRYTRGNNRPQEDAAIKKVMADTRKPRSEFWVNGFIRKGEWDKYEAKEIK
jgi:hypothetical protein